MTTSRLAALAFVGGLIAAVALRTADACSCAVGRVSLRIASSTPGVDRAVWHGPFVLGSQGTFNDADAQLYFDLEPADAP
jgi:hypothetical protein